jgi:hypothetical protein
MFDDSSHFRGHDKHAPPNTFAHVSITRRDPLVASTPRRDLLVRSAAPGWIIHFDSARMTSVPLRIRLHTFPSLGGTRSSRPPLGGTCSSGPRRQVGLSISIRRARQARPSEYVCTRFHHSEGRARRVHPSEGPACQVRGARLDYPFRFGGHDKRAPPNLVVTALSTTLTRTPLVGTFHCVVVSPSPVAQHARNREIPNRWQKSPNVSFSCRSAANSRRTGTSVATILSRGTVSAKSSPSLSPKSRPPR